MYCRNLFPLKIEFLKIKRDISLKNQLHNNYKIYRNRISILMKSTKRDYYTKYIESYISNIPGKTSKVFSLREVLPRLIQLCLLFKTELQIIQKELQIFPTIILVLLAKRPKLK